MGSSHVWAFSMSLMLVEKKCCRSSSNHWAIFVQTEDHADRAGVCLAGGRRIKLVNRLHDHTLLTASPSVGVFVWL
jgi:hypothetical protein